MKKRMLIFTLALLMGISLIFTGCGNSDTEDSGGGKIKKVDPFERISLVLYGKHGEATTKEYAWVLIETNDGYKEGRVAVEIPDNNGSLKNGDKLNVYIEEYDKESVAEEYGVIFKRTEAQIEICGLVGNPDYVAGKPNVVDLSDYIRVSEMGFEGYGWIQFQIDYERMIMENRECAREDAIAEKIGSENTVSAANYLLGFEGPYRMVCENYGYSASGTYTDVGGDIKNGDKIIIDWEEDTEVLDKIKTMLNIEFKNEKYTHTVKNLKPLVEQDPFERYFVELKGYNGTGFASGYVYCSRRGIGFHVISENNGALSNGDVIQVSLEPGKESLSSDAGIIPTRLEREIVITGLPEREYDPEMNCEHAWEVSNEYMADHLIYAERRCSKCGEREVTYECEHQWERTEKDYLGYWTVCTICGETGFEEE